MRPFDPHLIRAVPEARRSIGALGLFGILAGALAIGQAFAVTAMVVALVDGAPLRTPITAVAAVFGGRALVSALTEIVSARAGARVSTALRAQLLHRWLDRPADARPEPNVALTMATTGATTVEPYVARYLPALVSAAVLPACAIATLAVVDWLSALIVVLTVPLLPIFAALIGRSTQDATARRWRTSASLAGHFLDVVRGLPTLVSYGRATAQVTTIAEVSERHRESTMATLRVAFLSSVALELLATLSVAIVAVSVGLRLAGGTMALGTGLVAILLSPEAYWPIRRVGAEFHNAADGAAALDAILRELTAPAPAPSPARTDPGPYPPSARVTDITYTFPGASQATIGHLSVELPVGLTAVVGPSGVGKSTFLELLAGLRAPQHGTIAAPRAHLVTQTPFLTAGSLRDNLLLGTVAAAPSDSALTSLLDRVGLAGFVADLPEGFDTRLGDAGFGLSAGQRARIALARALLDPAPMILLDEPTAHLDDESIGVVYRVIAGLAQTRVVVVVTHRVDLLALADHHIALVSPQPAGARP